MSTAFHLETDGASERVNKSIGQILHAMVKPNQRDWVEKVPLVKFAINLSINSSSGFAPFELNYGYMPMFMTGIIPNDKAKPGVKAFVEQALRNLSMAHDTIIESRSSQTHQANKRRREGDVYKVGDLVYLSTKNLNLPKGRAQKLMPKFISTLR